MLKNLKVILFAFMLPALLLTGCVTTPDAQPAVLQSHENLRVMTYNILKGGTELGHPLSVTADVIKAARADVVVLQETKDSLNALAGMLGYEKHRIDDSVSILSRFPIAQRGHYGARVQPWTDRGVWVLGVHLEPYPYGPYDIRDYPSITEQELIDIAVETRAPELVPVCLFAKPHIQYGEQVILAGDFNEPSHLDWTPRAAQAGLHFGRSVGWPMSQAIYDTNLADVYRIIHPDEVAVPGETWTPRPDASEVHDRIDMIYFAGDLLTPISCEIVSGEDTADIKVQPYPSDHRAVVAEFKRVARRNPGAE